MVCFVRLEPAAGQHPDRACRECEMCEKNVVVLVDNETADRLADTQTGKLVGRQGASVEVGGGDALRVVHRRLRIDAVLHRFGTGDAVLLEGLAHVEVILVQEVCGK